MKLKIDLREARNSYRKVDVRSRADLFFQVGKTIGGKKIPETVFDLIVAEINRYLDIGKDDVLYDLCCDNGSVTYELSRHVTRIIGMDFPEHL